MELVVLKKAGEPGKVALNPELVTHLRSGPGNFVDVFFGDVKVAVEGTFEEVVNRISGVDIVSIQSDPAKQWFAKVNPEQTNVRR